MKNIALKLEKLGITYININEKRVSKHENLKLLHFYSIGFFNVIEESDIEHFKSDFETIAEFLEYFITYYVELILVDEDIEQYYKVKDGKLIVKSEHYYIEDNSIYIIFDTYEKM